MITIGTISELRIFLKEQVNNGKRIGFVPTMGALHEGHISLINRARAENDVVVCSIFVNPTQFNDQNDLINYPSSPKEDTGLLKDSGCDCLFCPSVEEMYPGSIEFDMNFGDLENVMEGKFRPGHFKGVAMVVSRFFEIINPDNAYFGEKDFQQLAIINEMNRRLGSSINIVGCPTLREPDGLAMSSRNVRLSENERNSAPVIYKAMKMAITLFREVGVTEARSKSIQAIEKVEGFKVQYLEFVDAETLQPVQQPVDGRKQRICVAVSTKKIRLIDNIAL